MRVDIDTYREIIDTLTRNKSRSLLTGFGVFWGVFMLIGLIGGGSGLKEKLSREFEGFATNSAFVFAQPTTKPYHGFRKGRQWSAELGDVERLKAQVPELDVVTPAISKWGRTVVAGDKRYSSNVKGLLADYAQVEEPQMRYGRFINDMDIAQSRKVCVLGKKVYKTLFPQGGDPCGEMVRIDSTYYRVVGVDYSAGNVSINGSAEESVCIPLTLMQQAYNQGNRVDLICLTAKPGVTMNTEVLFGVMDNMFQGVNFLIWLVGIGTLLAGAIGVSNIMMVTVRERTTEIGIRRAIGATPFNILGQIISESILLTAVAGMSGILFAVLILQMVEMGNTTDGIVEAHFQVGFWTAVGAVALLSVLGVMAGLAPAARAMSIKPVDAMRDE